MQSWRAGKCWALCGGCEEEWGLQRAGHVTKGRDYTGCTVLQTQVPGEDGGLGNPTELGISAALSLADLVTWPASSSASNPVAWHLGCCQDKDVPMLQYII